MMAEKFQPKRSQPLNQLVMKYKIRDDIRFDRRVLNLLFIFMFLILTEFAATAQESSLKFRQVDTETYRFYNEQKWDSLIYFGNRALTSDIDYFYLRVRLGIAYFEKKNYALATYHLEKALDYNSSDPATLEYLYYAYQYINRGEEARKLSGKFTTQLEEKIKPQKRINKLVVETGPVFSNNTDQNALRKRGNNNNEDFTLQDLYDDMFYLQAGAGINLSRCLSLYLGYDRLETNKLKQIQSTETFISGVDGIVIGGVIYPHNIYDSRQQSYESSYKLHQQGIYANAEWVVGHGFLITPAVHYLVIDYTTLFAEINQEEYLAQVYDTTPTTHLVYNIHEADQHYENKVFALGITKNHKRCTFGVEGTWSDLNLKDQWQLSGSLYWYPQGNLNFYTGSRLTYATEEGKSNLVFNQLAGFGIAKRIWIEGLVTVGEMRNFNENYGYVVYNSGDLTKFRAGANIIVPLHDKLELAFRYRFLSMETTRYSIRNDGSEYLQQLAYLNHSIIGGIQWKF